MPEQFSRLLHRTWIDVPAIGQIAFAEDGSGPSLSAFIRDEIVDWSTENWLETRSWVAGGIYFSFFLVRCRSRLSKRDSHSRRNGSSQSSTTLSAIGLSRRGRRWASRPPSISPAFSSTLRCLEM